MAARTKVNVSDFSIGVDGTNTVVMPAYFPRNFLLIRNNGPGTAGVNLTGGTAAMATRGTLQLASGQEVKFQKNVPQNAINAISASTSQLTVYSDDVIPVPSFVFQGTTPQPSIDLNFQTGDYWISPLTVPAPSATSSSAQSFLNVTRASAGSTNLLATSASGFSYTTWAANIARITAGSGLLVEQSRTNFLLNSTVPATQTTGALGTGSYVLWVNGSGSATSSAGTATLVGAGAATQGTPNFFTVTVAGTVVVTVAGSLNAFQLETAPPTSLILTTTATVTRAADTIFVVAVGGPAFTFMHQGTYNVSTVDPTINPTVMAMNDGTTNNAAGIVIDRTVGYSSMILTVGGVVQYSFVRPNNNPTFAVSIKNAYALADGDQAFTRSGVAPSTRTISPIFVPTRAYLGGDSAGGTYDGYVERVMIWPTTRLSNATLQSITT